MLIIDLERGYQLPLETETLRGVAAARASFQTSNLHPIIRNVSLYRRRDSLSPRKKRKRQEFF